MSDSVRPHPWDSPGSNTGVGCHFLLQCMKLKSESEVAQLCPTLQDPRDCSLPGSSTHGRFQARVLEQGAIAFSEKTYIESYIYIIYIYIYMIYICSNDLQESCKNNSLEYYNLFNKWNWNNCLSIIK